MKNNIFWKGRDMIGRKEEKDYLLSLLEEDESQFVAVFGRRRVGKTYLIRETFSHSFTFQHTGLSNNDIEPRKRKEAHAHQQIHHSTGMISCHCSNSIKVFLMDYYFPH